MLWAGGIVESEGVASSKLVTLNLINFLVFLAIAYIYDKA